MTYLDSGTSGERQMENEKNGENSNNEFISIELRRLNATFSKMIAILN
jgi:hypothetical protein